MAYSQMGSGFSGWNADTTTGAPLKKEASILLSAFKNTDLSLSGFMITAPAKNRKFFSRRNSSEDSETPRACGAGLCLSNPWR